MNSTKTEVDKFISLSKRGAIMKKKGSLQLGISTIVTLVIAMVLIAGGIAFIRGFLEQGTDTLGQAFDITEFTNPPDSQKPLVFAKGDQLAVKKGQKEVVKIGIFNKLSSSEKFVLEFSECATRTTTGPSPGLKVEAAPQLTSLGQPLNSGEGVVFNVFVVAKQGLTSAHPRPINPATDEDLPAGDYICTLITYTEDASDEYTSTTPFSTTDVVLEVFN